MENIPITDSSLEDASRDLSYTALLTSKRGNKLKAILSDDLKVILTPKVYSRLFSYFLKCKSEEEICTLTCYDSEFLIYLKSGIIDEFMEGNLFVKEGELDLSKTTETLISPNYKSFKVDNKFYNILKTGYKLFKKGDDRVAFSVKQDALDKTYLSVHSSDESLCKKIFDDLDSYARNKNMLKGRTVSNINIYDGSFEECISLNDYDWENYFFGQKVKLFVEEYIIKYLSNIDNYNSMNIDKVGVIFGGPPGTGKTTLAKIICNQGSKLGASSIWVTPDNVRDQGAVSVIKKIYELASYMSPCIVVMEDIDLWTYDRDEESDAARMGSFMNVLDGINSVKNVITIGLTNRIDTIESAIKNRPGRFDFSLHIGSLTADIRKQIITNKFKSYKINEKVINYLVEKTENHSAAYIQHVVNSCQAKAFNLKIKEGDHIDITVIKQVLEDLNNFSTGKKEDSLNKESGNGIGFLS